MEIRKAERCDLGEVLALQKTAFTANAKRIDNYSIQPLTQTLADLEAECENKTVLIIREEGKVIGSVRAYFTDGICYIAKLMVDPCYQKRGIGRMLMKEIEDYFPDAMSYELFTGKADTDNISFYEKQGYILYKEENMHNIDFVFFNKPADQRE